MRGGAGGPRSSVLRCEAGSCSCSCCPSADQQNPLQSSIQQRHDKDMTEGDRTGQGIMRGWIEGKGKNPIN